MRAPIALSLLLFMCVTAFAQETKSTSKSANGYTEKFNVLRSDKTIKHGSYKLTNDYSGELVADGFYKNNKRDSIWHAYVSNKVVAEGWFKEDNLYGEWVYYSPKGELINKYDHTKKALTYHLPTKGDTASKYSVISGTDTITTKLTRAPIYLPGLEMLYRNIARYVRYPATARVGRVTGTVIIGFTIDENGATRDYKVIKGIGAGCDEEALRVVRGLNTDWVAGINNGKSVTVQFKVPITFNLQ